LLGTGDAALDESLPSVGMTAENRVPEGYMLIPTDLAAAFQTFASAPIPTYHGKSLYELDLDRDVSEKPWEFLPAGHQISDYFNYGFTKETWTLYCAKQIQVRRDLQRLREQAERLQSQDPNFRQFRR
jgi:hypothetical protein